MNVWLVALWFVLICSLAAGAWCCFRMAALHEELGWTWDEYARYVQTGVLPPKREGAQ